MRGVRTDRRMNTNESAMKTTMRVKECTAKIQNREHVRSRHFEPLIRDVRIVESEKQEAVVAGVVASKRNDEFLAIFVYLQATSIALAMIQTTRDTVDPILFTQNFEQLLTKNLW